MFRGPPRKVEEAHQRDENNVEFEQNIKKLEQELLDLKITNRGKDYFIEQLQKERDAFITKIESNSFLIGELKTKLLQLEAPRRDRASPTSQYLDASLPTHDNGTDYE